LSDSPRSADEEAGLATRIAPPTFGTTVTSALNPLSALPSVLAIRDLRQRARRAVLDGDRQIVSRLLALDPLAVLRCLRAASAPISRIALDTWSVANLGAALGSSLTRRALDVPMRDVSGTGPIRQLWLHAIATGMAARTLAAATRQTDPEAAYLLGLLHDLPEWLHYLSLRQGGTPVREPAAEWIRHWELPPAVAQPLIELCSTSGQGAAPPPSDAVTLVRAAEFLAELADFWHPDSNDPQMRQIVLAAASRDDLLSAQHLRHEVQELLRQAGLESTEPPPEPERADPLEDNDLFPSRRHGNVSEVVLGILDCNKAASYRSIVTATTAAALRFLDYDRACYVKWIRAEGRLQVRAKADLSPRKIAPLWLAPSPPELAALQRAFDEQRPVRVEAGRGEAGLLRWLGADEVLLAPMNREFSTPAFLVLDRAITTRPILFLQDEELAGTLGHTASLLIENLLLKRRRQRAQKFALTDPLTRLYNRTSGIHQLEVELARSHRTGRTLTALMLDVDDFKRLNDRYGHLQGDVALRAMADVMRKTVRRSDTVCRYGGEEFLVVLPETGPDDAAILAARLAAAVEACGTQLELPLTASIGMAAVRENDTVEAILQRADQALYASKAFGRNRFSIDADA
jgi:diguanylate cyclase (GGDEF)-like protein